MRIAWVSFILFRRLYSGHTSNLLPCARTQPISCSVALLRSPHAKERDNRKCRSSDKGILDFQYDYLYRYSTSLGCRSQCWTYKLINCDLSVAKKYFAHNGGTIRLRLNTKDERYLICTRSHKMTLGHSQCLRNRYNCPL